ncbi:hypothetical protein ACRRVD_03070 [Candidatus Cardinium hertigii]|uniref:hypothetical protein n=1 Tax=Candidatus Cardinium hertigii TaxID=247481 RepID=UPI003D7E1D5E
MGWKYLLAQMASKYVKGIIVGKAQMKLFLAILGFKLIKYLQGNRAYTGLL